MVIFSRIESAVVFLHYIACDLPGEAVRIPEPNKKLIPKATYVAEINPAVERSRNQRGDVCPFPEVAQNLKAKPVTPLSGDVNELGTNMTERLRRDFDCVSLDNNAFYPGEPRIDALEVLQTAPETNEYQVFFYHSDHLGSSSFITDINGDATQHLQYLPFGEDFVHQQNTAAYYTPYTFSGKERDVETSLSYFGARYYEAGLSIWLSVDPLSDKYPSLSAYNYCALNPVMLVDPDGKQLDDYFDQNGIYLYTDNKTSDEIRIIHSDDWKQIEMQYGSQLNDKTASHAGLNKALESRSTGIAETKLSGEAVRKIMNNIVARMPDVDMSKLHNQSISTFDYGNSTYNTNDGHASGDASTVILPNGQIRITLLIIGGLVPSEFNTISNVQNALGAHEYLAHGIARVGESNHYKAYDMQFAHPTWKATTKGYKSEMEKRAKDYKKP